MVITRLAPGVALPSTVSVSNVKEPIGNAQRAKRKRFGLESQTPIEADVPSKETPGSKKRKKQKLGNMKTITSGAESRVVEKVVSGIVAPAKTSTGQLSCKVDFKGAPEQKDGILNWFLYHYEQNSKGLSQLEMFPGMNTIHASEVLASDGDEILSFEKAQSLIGKKRKAILVSASAVRSCAVLKLITGSLKRPITKLFAKHLKMEDQIESIKKQKQLLAVGTPNRLLKLGESGSLDSVLDDVNAYLLFDLEKDLKNFNVATLPGIRADCFAFLRKCYLGRPVGKRAKIGFVI